ncbi:MAG: cell division protein CrgA [Microbacteriaceae bacterium]|nr:cell division protein CrgA [Microbacteriaceae bacterium]MCI1207783.1 cell division protein CrgA [Microbacteriaceae bacterium]
MRPTPVWYKIVMFGLMLLGLIWVIVFYISGQLALPIPPIGNWNILIGFGLMMVGFLMTIGWR